MRVLFVASLHHPQALVKTRRQSPPDENPLFPMSQAHYFWVRALRKAGHSCGVFWRSESVLPWVETTQLRAVQRPGMGQTFRALLEKVPSINPDFRLRNLRLIRYAAQFQPDVIILVGGNTVILPQTLAELKRSHGAVLVFSSGTSPVVFSTPPERAAAALYDLVICNDRYHAVQWQELGAPRVETLPLSAVDPEIHHPYPLSEDERAQYDCDIGFVGTLVPSNLYGERVSALESLRDYNLGIWSIHEVPASLRRFHRGPALGEQMLRATCAARIVVNPHGNFMRYGGNMRLFEACGAGAFQIADDRPGIREWFTVGKHLATYRDTGHLREMVSYYLAHEKERQQIAEAGRKHVYAHHTYDQRMARLISLVEEIRHDKGL
jgi:spore maturation protein CgeB